MKGNNDLKRKICICAGFYKRFLSKYFEFYDGFMSYKSNNLCYKYKSEQYIREYNFCGIFLDDTNNKMIYNIVSKVKDIEKKHFKILNYLLYTPELDGSTNILRRRGKFGKYWGKDRNWELGICEISCLNSAFCDNNAENFIHDIESLYDFLEKSIIFFRHNLNRKVGLNYVNLVGGDIFETLEEIKNKAHMRKSFLCDRELVISMLMDVKYDDFWVLFFKNLGDCYLNMHLIIKKFIESCVDRFLANQVYAELVFLMLMSLEFDHEDMVRPNDLINIMRIITGIKLNNAYDLDSNYIKNKKFSVSKTVNDFYFSFKGGENANFFEPFRFLMIFYPKCFVKELNNAIHILCSVLNNFIKSNTTKMSKINMLKTVRCVYVTIEKLSRKYISTCVILEGFKKRILRLISIMKKDINSTIEHKHKACLLGKGGYGKVMLYYNKSKKRNEAVKILREDKYKIWDRERILKLSDLNSKNIAKIYSLTDDEKFLTMEYIEDKQNYYHYMYTIRNNTCKILDILIQIVSGLKDLSDAGFYHNDLDQHTNNILISKEGEVKIIDYDQSIFRPFPDCNKENAIKQIVSILYFFRIDLYKKFIRKFTNLNFIMDINKTNYPYVKNIFGDKLPSSDELIGILREMRYDS